MVFLIEEDANGFTIKYKLDEYYNSNLKLFLQSIALTKLLPNCSLTATPNEAYYRFSFEANSLCTLREYLFTPNEPVSYNDGYKASEESDSDSEDSYNVSTDDSGNNISEEESEKSSIIVNKRKKLANGIENLFSYKQAILMIGSLSAQLSALHKKRLSFYTFDLDSILVINNNIFIMVNPSLVVPVNGNGLLTFLSPVKTNNPFICPEIANYTVLPFHCNYTNIYYSFAVLVIYCLYDVYIPLISKKGARARADEDEDEDEEDEEDNNDNVIEGRNAVLSKLYGTKLYWFLTRCLEENGGLRQLYYI
jgi:hypothetical protein